MIDLFADVPEEMIENTLQTIRENLGRVGLYGGHTLRRHTDVQLLALRTRLTKEDILFAASYWDAEVADAVVRGIMRSFFDSSIVSWLKYRGSDSIFAGQAFSNDHRVRIPERRGKTGREFKESLPGARERCGHRLGVPDIERIILYICV